MTYFYYKTKKSILVTNKYLPTMWGSSIKHHVLKTLHQAYEWRKLAFTIVSWMKSLFSWLAEADDESITFELNFLEILKTGFDDEPLKCFIELAQYPSNGNELKNLTGLIRILSTKLISDDQVMVFKKYSMSMLTFKVMNCKP